MIMYILEQFNQHPVPFGKTPFEPIAYQRSHKSADIRIVLILSQYSLRFLNAKSSIPFYGCIALYLNLP
jgi:hypothetical protein